MPREAKPFISPEAASALVDAQHIDKETTPLVAPEVELSTAAVAAATTIAEVIFHKPESARSNPQVDMLTYNHLVDLGIPLSGALLGELLSEYRQLVDQSQDITQIMAAERMYTWFSPLVNSWSGRLEGAGQNKQLVVPWSQNMNHEINLGDMMTDVDLVLDGHVCANIGDLALRSSFVVRGSLIGPVLDNADTCNLSAESITTQGFLHNASACRVEAETIDLVESPQLIGGGCTVVADVISGDITSNTSDDTALDHTAHVTCKTHWGSVRPAKGWSVSIGGSDV